MRSNQRLLKKCSQVCQAAVVRLLGKRGLIITRLMVTDSDGKKVLRKFIPVTNRRIDRRKKRPI